MAKNFKTSAKFNFISAVCYYLAAAIGFLIDGDYSVIFLCLGSLSVIAGGLNMKRYREAEGKTEQ